MSDLHKWLKRMLFNHASKPTKTNDLMDDGYGSLSSVPIRIKDLLDDYDCSLSAVETVNQNLLAAVIADCHGSLSHQELCDRILPKKIDIFLLLGDNFPNDIDCFLDFASEHYPSIPIVGVEGNHDQHGLLKTVGNSKVINIHKDVMTFGNIKIGGFSGSIKYKPDDYYVMYTNEESQQLLSDLPYCDLFITHDKPCFAVPENITSHSGLIGIGNYIRRQKPAIVLHGHLHDRYLEQYENTFIRCCYRVEVLDIRL